MRKAVIGLIPLWDDARASLWMLPGYADAVAAAGGVPMTLPLTDDSATLAQVAGMIDGLLLTGGHDVAPACYGEQAIAECGKSCARRDSMELALIRLMLAAHKPIFGICRGIQMLNVSLGGTLYQNLALQHPSPVDHHMSPPYDRAVHGVSISAGTLLRDIVGADALGVNSYHHQAVRKLAPALRASAVSEDGLVEGVELAEEKFVVAVQWHPEFRYRSDEPSMCLFRRFVDACQG